MNDGEATHDREQRASNCNEDLAAGVVFVENDSWWRKVGNTGGRAWSDGMRPSRLGGRGRSLWGCCRWCRVTPTCGVLDSQRFVRSRGIRGREGVLHRRMKEKGRERWETPGMGGPNFSVPVDSRLITPFVHYQHTVGPSVISSDPISGSIQGPPPQPRAIFRIIISTFFSPLSLAQLCVIATKRYKYTVSREIVDNQEKLQQVN